MALGMFSRQITYFLIAATITISAATLHGRLAGRWGSSVPLADRGRVLSELPTELGNWKLLSDEGLPASSVEMLQCAAHQHRLYKNQLTGSVVDLLLILGPPGPTSVHIPEICYPSQNYKRTAERQHQLVTTTSPSGETWRDEFWSVTFETNDDNSRNTQVYYGWSVGPEWEAPEQPRFHFAGAPWLYKLQLSSQAPAPRAAQECQNFLQSLLPTLHARMASAL